MTDIKIFCLLILMCCSITLGLCFGSLLGVNDVSVIKVDHHQCILRGAAFSQTMSCDWNTTQQKGK